MNSSLGFPPLYARSLARTWLDMVDRVKCGYVITRCLGDWSSRTRRFGIEGS